MSAITTYRGHLFDPLNPNPSDIDPVDIAHALSLLCRAGGHFAHFYSVGQHCLNCAAEAAARGYSPRVVALCLLHDASEAYLSDITRPVKAHLARYLAIEANLQNAIYQKFLGTLPTEDELMLVRSVDDTLLHYEFLKIMNDAVFDHAPKLFADLSFDFIDFTVIEARYLTMLDTLIPPLH